MATETLERRPLVLSDIRLQKAAGKVGTLSGYAARFNSDSADLGGFTERIDPAAFDWTLEQNPDVRALINHDPSLLLGRTRSDTLRLKTDAKGLKIEVDLPDTSYARDLVVSMERGDLTQMSFAFRTIEDSWDFETGPVPIRTLRKVDLNDGDISPVTTPAYPETSVSVRALEAARAKIPNKPVVDDKAEYFRKLRERIALARK